MNHRNLISLAVQMYHDKQAFPIRSFEILKVSSGSLETMGKELWFSQLAQM
jgi:hypothetical protein